MINRKEFIEAKNKAAKILNSIGVSLRKDELEQIEVVDFGLGELNQSGVQILTLVATEKITVKLLVLFPLQTHPEHKHPPFGSYPGKEETIRCEWGILYLYTPGEPNQNPKSHPPKYRVHTYSVWHEYILSPGQQMTLQPNIPHWFQAGKEGAVVWSFSTKAVDIQDIFTDPDIVRTTVVVDE